MWISVTKVNGQILVHGWNAGGKHHIWPFIRQVSVSGSQLSLLRYFHELMSHSSIKKHLWQITLPWGFLAPQISRNTNKWRITVHVARAILSAVSTVYGIQKHLHQIWEHFRMRFRTEVPQHVVYKDEKEVPMGTERKMFHIMRFNLFNDTIWKTVLHALGRGPCSVSLSWMLVDFQSKVIMSLFLKCDG